MVKLGELIDTAYDIHQRATTDRFIVRITTAYITFRR